MVLLEDSTSVLIHMILYDCNDRIRYSLTTNPSHRGGNPNHPVEMVSLANITLQLETQTIPAGWEYALPTADGSIPVERVQQIIMGR